MGPAISGGHSPNEERSAEHFAVTPDSPVDHAATARPHRYRRFVDDFDAAFSFYDDKDYVGDADANSRLLQAMHARLWSKALPNGDVLNWSADHTTCTLSTVTPAGSTLRVSSDTIATTHAGYYRRAGRADLLAHFEPQPEKDPIERAFYTIGGFIVFPVHRQSLNQQRGTRSEIKDRFDLTLECIRRYYVGQAENPLRNVLAEDAAFFALFGSGLDGFINYVQFFHLQPLLADGSIRWFDGHDRDDWDFTAEPLPAEEHTYSRYLDNVGQFVSARTKIMTKWLRTN